MLTRFLIRWCGAAPVLGLAATLAQGVADVTAADFRGAAAPAALRPGSVHTTAMRVLALESEVREVSEACFGILEAVVTDACDAIGRLERRRADRWDGRYAEQVLKCIDEALIAHGFLYPEAGAVDLLADGLQPFQMDSARRWVFEAMPQNARRVRMIASRYPGPFHALDCDTASLVYLEVADRRGLPLYLVMIPSRDRRLGHTFVRWQEGARHLNWETLHGATRPDDYYVKEWNIPAAAIKSGCAMTNLSRDEVAGGVLHLRAVQYARRRDFERALRDSAAALALYPNHLDARRQLAWLLATIQSPALRDPAAALAHATFVLARIDDADIHDTLAAAHAAADCMDEAVQEQRKALARCRREEDRIAYLRRLNAYRARATGGLLPPAGDPVSTAPRTP